MQLNPFTKMRVGLARDTLSRRVAYALEDVPGSKGTQDFILLFDKWFDIVTCGVMNPIRSCDDERLIWLENQFRKYLLDWRNEVDTLHPGEEKRIIAKQTYDGLLFTTTNMVHLTKHLLQNGIEYVCLKTLTQDVLEAVFGNLRSNMRRNTNPDVAQVSYSVSAITQRKIIKKVKGGNTTFGKKNAWTHVCHDPLPKVSKKK
ncbi:uncharacterized protein LOC100175756 [Ciona intestinalis]